MHVRKWVLGGLGVAAAVAVASTGAWACVSGPAVTLNPASAKPGDTVTVSLRDFRKADPIQVRWNDLSAPVLAAFASDGSGSPIAGTFSVPGDAKAGNYVVIFSQSAPDGKASQMPVRALLTVTSPNGASPVLGAPASPVDVGRPVGLAAVDNSVSGATLALVGLGVAGVGMFVAGLAALFAGRRNPAPEAARVRK